MLDRLVPEVGLDRPGIDTLVGQQGRLLLNGLFSEFDRLALDLGVKKIKTVGDAYMLAGGLPEPRTDHAHAVADMAIATCRPRCRCASAFIRATWWPGS
jgi:class 3 adenylate cyclase